MGAGVTTLYFSVFAAANFYHLIGMNTAFAAMAAVTVLSGTISLRFGAKLVAVIGVAGGYLTPVMLSTGTANFPGLYGYLLVLGCGVLWLCSRKDWPLLNYLSFVCHWTLTVVSLRQYELDNFHQVMPFVVAFFALFSTMVFIFNLFNAKRSNLLEVLVLFLNAGIFFGISFWLVEERFSRQWVAAVTLGLAAFYTAHVYYCLVRRVLDRELMLSFIGLAAFFLIVTAPLLLSREWITASWSLQALVLLWIACRLNSRFLQHTAYVLYLMVLFRFGFLDLPSQYARGIPGTDVELAVYVSQLVQRLATFGIPIGSLFAARFVLRSSGVPAVSLTMLPENDIPAVVRRSWALSSIVVSALGMLFVFLHLELNRTVGYILPDLRLPALTMLWLAMCFLLVWEYRKTSGPVIRVLLCVFIAGLLLKLLLFDLRSWDAGLSLMYGDVYRFRDAGFRLLDFGMVLVFFAAAFQLLAGQQTASMRRDLAITGLALMFLVTTLELNSFLYHFVPGLRSGGISILWTIYALALVLVGIRRNIKPLRLTGLILFTVVAGKVFFFDLASLDQIYRVVAFILLGILVLSGSFIYLKYRSVFATEDEAGQAAPDELSGRQVDQAADGQQDAEAPQQQDEPPSQRDADENSNDRS
jgi:uncharacterized membrane protein